MLNDEHGATVIDQLVQKLEQLFDIVVMKPCSWFVKGIEGAAPELFAQFCSELDPLGLSPAQRRRRLSKFYVPKPRLLDHFQFVDYPRNILEMLHGLVYRQFKHISDRQPLVLYLERLPVVPRSFADIAFDIDILQKEH